MLQLRPLDPLVPIAQQLGATQSPVVLINLFTVDAKDIDALRKAWEADANWMKRQTGCISTQLHRGIGGFACFSTTPCGSLSRTSGRRSRTRTS